MVFGVFQPFLRLKALKWFIRQLIKFTYCGNSRSCCVKYMQQHVQSFRYWFIGSTHQEYFIINVWLLKMGSYGSGWNTCRRSQRKASIQYHLVGLPNTHACMQWHAFGIPKDIAPGYAYGKAKSAVCMDISLCPNRKLGKEDFRKLHWNSFSSFS